MDPSTHPQGILAIRPGAERPAADGAGMRFERWLGLSAYAIVMVAGAVAVLL